jgi:hypothetical protein
MHTRTTAQRANNAHRRNHGKTRKTKEYNERQNNPTKKHGENQIYEIEKAEHGDYGEGIS